ncbi:MAG: GGDEF domain-containing protein [Saccharospirillum sp.]|nr:GGDEF domain-containing protein [Saccharospirillum sp.]
MSSGSSQTPHWQGNKALHIDQPELVKNGSATALTVKDFRLHLMTQLQTSLDTEYLLRTFFSEIQHLVPLSGCHYRNESVSIDIQMGESGRHKCSYHLAMGDEQFGEIVFSKTRRIAERELAMIEAQMDVLIYPLRNSLKHRSAVATAMIDPLTGLSNRSAMALTLSREIDRCKRHHQDLSILMIDIDQFKVLNDRYGHLVGDDVLRQVSQILNDEIRGCDACFRFGGEEFLVMLTDSNLPLARLVSERLRRSIAEHTRSPNPNQPVTVSIGVAHYENEADWPDLVERADRALYDAKAAGRNRVVTNHVRSVDGVWPAN